MEKETCLLGVNIVGFKRDEKMYGMCVAWATMVDYDKLICLIGSQSITGNMMHIGDTVGFSALNKDQSSIAYKIGSAHSNKTEKFEGIAVILKDSALLIKDAKTNLVCKVIDELKLSGDENDHLFVLQIISGISNPNIDYLQYNKM